MINKIWSKLFKPVWSFIINLVYWIFNIFSLPEALDTKKIVKNSIKELIHVKSYMKKFTWTKDNYKDWNPWVITIIHRDLKDDCDGAAVLAIWLLSLVNIESQMVHLYGEKSGHAVCVSKDRTIMFSNNDFVSLKPDNWEKQVLSCFGDRYTKVVV